MPDTTTIQSLPLILASQAQKHVTHNEALRLIDVMVQLSVINRTLTVAPAAPALGQCHIVASAATGLWLGQATKVAVWTGTLWEFFTPRTGWFGWVSDEQQLTVFNGTAWAAQSQTPGLFSQVGVSAVPDATNRLSVSSPATLLNNAGAGHQLKINKAVATDTASLLFQTGFSGRAEMGTVSGDDFSVKVSADGTTFFQGLVIDRTSGRVRVMNGLGINPVAGDPAAPVNGDVWYNLTTAKFRVRQAGVSVDLIGSAVGAFSDAAFVVQDNLDATKQAQFELAGITTGTTRVLSVPDLSGEIAVLPGVQTFTGAKTFSGGLTASGASASIGTATVAATYGMGTGATVAAAVKAVDLGTGGVSGSVTNVVIGSATAGALGTVTVNTPAVVFASTVTSVQAASANLAAAQVGVGGATADATNRLAVTSPATLLNNAGAGHQVKVNKNAAADTASLLFQTGASGRIELGTVGNDDFTIKVSTNGSSYSDALRVTASTARVTAVNGMVLNPNAGDIATPGDGSLWYNSTTGKFRAQMAGVSADVLTTANPVIIDSSFTLQDDIDISKQAKFQLSGITTATTQTYTLPNVTGALATIGNLNQTFSGVSTFSNQFTLSGATVTLGTSAVATTVGLATGAVTTGLAKAVNIGTGGASGSTTTIAIGSAVAGALGTTTFATPTVSYGATVTAVQMGSASLTALQAGIGGAVPDATNRLSVTAPASLFSNIGAGHQVKINKAAATDTASLLFQTGFSGRAEIGTTGADDFTIKVSADGTTFFDGVVFDRATGRTRVQNGLRVTPAAGDLAGPVDGEVWYNATSAKFRARQGGASVDLIGAGGGGSVFSDGSFAVQNTTDATKQVKLDLSGVTTATVRTLGVPNASGTIVLDTAAQVLTGKTISFASNTFAGTMAAAQMPGLTGDVTSSAGAVATTIAAGAVTNAKLANMAAATFKGNNTAAAAAPVDMTAAQAKAALAISSGDVSGLGALAVAASVSLTTQATGVLQAAQEPAHSGDVTNAAGSLALSIAASAVSNAKLANMAAATFKGNNTGVAAAPVDMTAAQAKAALAISSGDVSGLGALAVAASVSLTTQATGVLQAAQEPAHSGDVTNAAGSLALSIAANVVDNTKLAQIATASFKGRSTAGTGNVEDLTATQATALLNPVSSTLKGLAPASGGGNANYLRADGTWATPTAGAGGATTQVQVNSGGALAGASEILVENNQLRLPAAASFSAPAAGGTRLVGRTDAGRVVPAFLSQDGVLRDVQTALTRSSPMIWKAQAGTAALTVLGGAAPTAVGTATAANIATTNLASYTPRLEYLVTVAATTAIAGFRGTNTLVTVGGPSAGLGGFQFTGRWGPATGVATTTNRAFFGLAAITSAPTDVEPSTSISAVFMGWDAADANVQMMTNDGAGTCTKVDLGASFPVPLTDRTALYELALYSPKGVTQSVAWLVTDLLSGATASGTIVADVPTTATLLAPRGWMSVGGTSSVIGLGLNSLVLDGLL